MTSRPAPHAETGRIGRYSLVSRIGEGGMGVVHLAQSPAGEQVALKVLRPHVVGDDEGRARLAREVSSLRRVRSRRVAEVYDADPWGDQPFVVTRYVRGPSLHDRVRETGGLEDDELRALAVGLVEAVIAVHEAGVLHRDIKPSNVLLENARDPVLIDFGLAKLAEDSKLTATGWLMGTPGYLAPEVLYGEDATPAADIHAWAATVVFAATGETPFGKGPSMAVMDRARRGEHDLSGVPGWLTQLLRECLSPDPGDRPSAKSVLTRLTSSQVPLAPPASGAPATRPLTAAVPPRLPPMTPPPPEPVTKSSHPVLRAALMAGLLALFATALALAPYVTAIVALLAAWLVRAASWSADAMADRRALRGQRRSDSLVRTFSVPWHLLVSLPGAVVLLGAACASAASLATVLWAFGMADVRALFAGGVLGGIVLWLGPGSRRIRRLTRRAIWHATRPEAAAGVYIGAVVGAAVLLMVSLAAMGVLWWPADAPPFNPRDLVPPGFR